MASMDGDKKEDCILAFNPKNSSCQSMGLKIMKTDCTACHQLVAYVQGCKNCSSDMGISVVCLDEDCDYSFDLCFECAELAIAKGGRESIPIKTISAYDKQKLIATKKIALQGYAHCPLPILIPSNTCRFHCLDEYFFDDIPDCASPMQANLMSHTSTDKSRRHAPERDNETGRDGVHDCAAGHQLVAYAHDCKKCSSDSGISVVCVDEDCEYSFDLCFECDEAVSPSISALPRSLTLFHSYSA